MCLKNSVNKDSIPEYHKYYLYVYVHRRTEQERGDGGPSYDPCLGFNQKSYFFSIFTPSPLPPWVSPNHSRLSLYAPLWILNIVNSKRVQWYYQFLISGAPRLNQRKWLIRPCGLNEAYLSKFSCLHNHQNTQIWKQIKIILSELTAMKKKSCHIVKTWFEIVQFIYLVSILKKST